MRDYLGPFAMDGGQSPRCQAHTYAPYRVRDDEYAHVRRLAAEIAAMPALLSLPTRRLVADVMAVKGVCKTYAYRAVGFARRMK